MNPPGLMQSSPTWPASIGESPDDGRSDRALERRRAWCSGSAKRVVRGRSREGVMFLEQAAGRVAIGAEHEKAIEDRDKEARQRLGAQDEIRVQCGAIVGESPALKAALQLVSVVAP